MGPPGSDDGYSIKDEMKRIIVGIIFVAAMPAFLIFATDIDILQGCVLYSDAEINAAREFKVIDENGNETTVTAEERKCKQLSTGSGPLTEILDNVQYYVPIGIGLFMLAFGVALLLGPGIKVIKYQFGK